MKNNSDFFTTGELSRITGLSKQLLIFYDKKKVFSSTSTESNGYRHYLLSQYFRLKALITLRKFGLSLDEILKYFQTCDTKTLQTIYEQKIQDYSKEIQRLSCRKDFLEKRLALMRRQEPEAEPQILIREIHTPITYFRWNISMETPLKERILQIAKILYPYVSDADCLDDSIAGWLLPSRSLDDKENSPASYSFFTECRPSSDIPAHERYVVPSGIYVTLRSYGHYGMLSPEARERLNAFIHLNDMTPQGDILVFPSPHCWITLKEKWPITAMILIKPISYSN